VRFGTAALGFVTARSARAARDVRAARGQGQRGGCRPHPLGQRAGRRHGHGHGCRPEAGRAARTLRPGPRSRREHHVPHKRQHDAHSVAHLRAGALDALGALKFSPRIRVLPAAAGFLVQLSDFVLRHLLWKFLLKSSVLVG